MLGLFGKKKTEDKTDDPCSVLCAALKDSDLPTFPTVITEALQKVRDDEASVGSISDLLSTDPGISIRLLGTVNSAAFALRHEVKSIQHAVSLLGRGQLESMLISLAVRDTLPRTNADGYDSKQFWKTAARRATVGRALAEVLDPATRSETFTACLLQDLAIPILAHHEVAGYGDLLRQWYDGSEDLSRLESDAYGWDHARVGESMARTWEFPERIACAIGSHHAAPDEPFGPLPAARLVSVLRGENEGGEQLVEVAHERFGLPEDQVVGLNETASLAAADIAQLFG